jgi:hypothetical protein
MVTEYGKIMFYGMIFLDEDIPDSNQNNKQKNPSPPR